jgi:hypothetical protein
MPVPHTAECASTRLHLGPGGAGECSRGWSGDGEAVRRGTRGRGLPFRPAAPEGRRNLLAQHAGWAHRASRSPLPRLYTFLQHSIPGLRSLRSHHPGLPTAAAAEADMSLREFGACSCSRWSYPAAVRRACSPRRGSHHAADVPRRGAAGLFVTAQMSPRGGRTPPRCGGLVRPGVYGHHAHSVPGQCPGLVRLGACLNPARAPTSPARRPGRP